MSSLPFAIQCYSVRDHLDQDAAGTFRRLKEIGYDHVELFDIRPETAAPHREWVEAAGLGIVGAHMDFELVTARTDEAIAAARTLGVDHVIIPWAKLDSAEAWTDAARAMAAAGAQLRGEGLHLGYHHHEHEFEFFGGRTAFDIIFETAPAEDLFIEIDTYWAEEGGADPVALLERFGTRCRLLHVKDRAEDGPCRFAEVGAGTTDWRPIFETARATGVRALIVEQDDAAVDSLASAAISASYMSQLE